MPGAPRMPEFQSGSLNRFKVKKSTRTWLFTKIWISMLICALVASLAAGQFNEGVKLWQEGFIHKGPRGFFLMLTDLFHFLTKYIHQFFAFYLQEVKSLLIHGESSIL